MIVRSMTGGTSLTMSPDENPPHGLPAITFTCTSISTGRPGLQPLDASCRAGRPHEVAHVPEA